MKKHLFYSFLGIFVCTSVVTLLGVLGIVHIADYYLGKLVWAFLIELAGAVIFIFRKANFFDDELHSHRRESEVSHGQPEAGGAAGPKTLVVSRGADLTADVTRAAQGRKPKEHSATDAVLTAKGYYEHFESVRERPLERDVWGRSLGGIAVKWVGIFNDVSELTEHKIVQLSFTIEGEKKGRLFFGVAPMSFRDLAYSLRIGDRVEIAGTISPKYGGVISNPTIDVQSMRRLSDGEPRV